MLISIVLAWIATACAILTALKIIVKKNKKINKIFHKIHIPCGIILIVTGLIHGLIAGNPLGTSIDKISVGSTFLTFNFGTISFVIGILLGFSYLFRKVLRNTSIKWIVIHRILTLGLVLTVIIHVFQVGISLPNAISKTVSGVNLETLGNSSKDTTVSGTSSFSGANLKDGTYEGSAEGYKSTIKVSVTVENGTVTLIKIMDENETPQYIQRAESIIDNIINNQSLNVDAVSGATFSSKGIVEAVENALQTAVSEGQIESNDIQVDENRKHKGKNRKITPFS